MLMGVDEAGRGALAGPVVAAAVVLDPTLNSVLFKDSKRLSARQRDSLFKLLVESDSQIGLGCHSNRWIDRTNILAATMDAMSRSIGRIDSFKGRIVIDGNHVPKGLNASAESIIKGDQFIPEISAASIIAKVTRDRIMDALAKKWPAYGFSVHKGYGTKGHYSALAQFGPVAVHRRTFNLSMQERLF